MAFDFSGEAHCNPTEHSMLLDHLEQIRCLRGGDICRRAMLCADKSSHPLRPGIERSALIVAGWRVVRIGRFNFPIDEGM